jgi:PAS domain-containing protein
VETTNLINPFILICIAVSALFLGKFSDQFFTWLANYIPSFEKKILNAIPAVLWVENNGDVTWSNAAFLKIQASFGAPLAFSNFTLPEHLKTDGDQRRGELKVDGTKKTLYFDISKYEFGQKKFYVALSAQAAVSAETDRLRFVQTLSETFAHLTIGMAVFDKERDLSLFNPALSDLLDVSPLWLANKPSLRDFLDRLHDKGALPEPRNFRSWRDQIIEMERSAETGTYFDDWHMPNDKVYRVTGRPHPKGAVAFVFEDITNTIAAEREYRLEIERVYSALDAVKNGIAIFDSSGTLSFANDCFDRIWKTELSKRLTSPSAIEVAEIWNSRSEPTPVLGEIKDFILSAGERANWSGCVRLKTGVSYEMRASVMAGGYSMVSFSAQSTIKSPSLSEIAV